MENNLPTAEEFFKELYGVNDRISTSNAVLLAKEFTKLHCEAQLKAILENVTTKNDPNSYTGNTGSEYPPDIIVDVDSIINSYPLNKIK